MKFFLGSFCDNLWVNCIHLVDPVFVHHHHGEIGEVQHQPLLYFLNALDHEGVRLLPGHVRLEVPVHDGGGEEPPVTVGSVWGLEKHEKISIRNL